MLEGDRFTDSVNPLLTLRVLPKDYTRNHCRPAIMGGFFSNLDIGYIVTLPPPPPHPESRNHLNNTTMELNSSSAPR